MNDIVIFALFKLKYLFITFFLVIMLFIRSIHSLDASPFSPEVSTFLHFSIHISLSSETVQNLKDGGFQLYGFKAVKASVRGVPLVWFVIDQYLVNTTVDWPEDYQAYISTQLNPIPGDVIKPCPLTKLKAQAKTIAACSSQVINLGEQMIVDKYGNTSVIQGSEVGAISIVNQAQTQWSCGMSQAVATPIPNPLSAFPLYGNNKIVLTPLKKVLLMFASEPVNTGTVVVESSGSGILVDLTDVQSRDLTYDINNGWGPTDQVWAKIIRVTSDITRLLIEQ
ncbi:hypothetical protein [[Phormidium] sp. ETS-05]|uniref:hypothetical protein n=1 Tax=[Phormidium] sp. ETS-05 TaxID=222819 RepID=UPI0018EED3EA|nr:hypothetical protein [[Phormidium] sp. ETS-05]